MAAQNNRLISVATYNQANLGKLRNTSNIISTAYKKFENFNEDFSANLGTTIQFSLPYRFNTVNALEFSTQALQQRVDTLTVGQQYSTSAALSDPQRILFFEKGTASPQDTDYYMENFGNDMVNAINTQLETNAASNFISELKQKDAITKIETIDRSTGGYRFYGNGVTPINSQTQLAEMNAFFRAYGCEHEVLNAFFPMIKIPQFLNTFLNQFVPERNEEIARKWMLGNYDEVDYYKSNLIQKHIAGTVGTLQQTLTVVSVTTDINGDVIGITASGASPSDPNAVVAGDMIQFNTSSNLNLFCEFGSFNQGAPIGIPAQNRIIANAASDGSGNVSISLFRPFHVGSAINDAINIVRPIVPGMQFTIPTSHFGGSLHTKRAFLTAMPRLPNQDPFPSSSMYDAEEGTSLLLSWGSVLGQAERIIGLQAISAMKLVPDYAMRVCFPLS